MNESNLSTLLQPVKASERIHILDILRGFAIFGILLVNIIGFATPSYLPGYKITGHMPWYDEIADLAVLYLADGKFFTIFSFLFGIGFSVQMARAESKGRSLMTFYPRRLAILLGIGLLHAILFWVDDILRLYALLGFLLLAFRKRSSQTLILWAGIFFALNYLFSLTSQTFELHLPNLAALGREIYQQGSFLTVVQFQAWASMIIFARVAQIQSGNVMALFLLGLLAGRARFFENLNEKRPLLKKILALGLLTGIVFNIIHHWLETTWLKNLDFMIGALGLSTAYICGLCLLWMHTSGAKWLEPLSQVGRMALTNYVLQSVLCSLIFNGYGLGLYEKVGSAGLWGISVAIFMLQVSLSRWWLTRFQFGPLEWLWRSLTYMQKQPFRRKV
ncbi:MAG: DUF418 domain-containing protein [Anaerolineales bacterium]